MILTNVYMFSMQNNFTTISYEVVKKLPLSKLHVI